MSQTERSAIEAMRGLRREIEKRLMQSEDYRALVALDRAIQDIRPSTTADPAAPLGSDIHPGLPQKAGAGVGESLSQADAADAVLRRENRPLTSVEMLPLIRGMGVHVGGDRPHINLGSSLSRDGRFRSVKIGPEYRWWFKAEPHPGERSVLSDEKEFASPPEV